MISPIRSATKLLLGIALWSTLPGTASGFSLFSLDQNPRTLSAGNQVLRSGARLSGMGGAGIALTDTINYTLANPATLASLDFTILSVTYKPEITYLEEKNNSGTTLNFGNDFPFAEIIVPLGKYGVVFGGYKQDRLLDYDIQYTDDNGHSIHRYGHGGTYIAQFGYALAVKPFLLTGITFGNLYGNTRIGNSNTNNSMPSSLIKTTFNGQVMDGGVVYKSGKLSVGLSGTFPIGDADIKQEGQTIQKLSSDSIVIKVPVSGIQEQLPMTGTLGVAYSPSKRLNLALDVSATRWDAVNRGDELRAATGLEFFPSVTRSDHYFLNIPLRAGYYYHDLGYAEKIKEQALTFGFSLPTLNHYGYLNIAIEGGKRYQNSLAESALKETFSAITIQYVHKGRWGRLRRATNDF